MSFLEEKKLANGLQLSFHDHSRPLAGDRWLVELRCTAEYPLSADLIGELVEPDAELKAAMVQRLGDSLEFTVRHHRQFVDQREKDQVLTAMLARVKEHLLNYMAKPDFPARLFQDTCRRLREECLLARHQGAMADQEPEEEGPADFSALFRLPLDK